MDTSSVNGFNGKRTFDKLRKQILMCLSRGQMTVNEIANCSNINWKTVDNHLIYLTGRGFVREVLNCSYVRIYELTEEGKHHLLNNVSRKVKIGNNIKYATVKTTNVTVL